MPSSDIAISVRNLSKSYTITHNAPKRPTFRDVVMEKLRNPFRKPQRETFWALKDVNFDIKKGDVVGIIGRNGAGKSTLLKILSQITEPTTGKIDLYGRVGSLLEVGTGFHPELTGRENIYLNGQILGMRKSEIDKQFDAIVDFSGVEKFLDTPVKRYSSGMYIRLAFAVAAHLESEILIVDEVLAVGDAAFQRKCLGRMRDVAAGGRTVLFVSHNMPAVQSFCSRAIALGHGKVQQDGCTLDIVDHYMRKILPESRSIALARRTDRSGNGLIKLISFHIENAHGEQIEFTRSGADTILVFGYEAHDLPKDARVDVGFSFGVESEQLLTVFFASYVGSVFTNVPRLGMFRCKINALPVAHGEYTIGARVFVNGDEADWPRDGVGSITVDRGDFYKTGHVGFEGRAPMLIKGEWDITAEL